MEILLAITVTIVAATCLFIAFTFRSEARENRKRLKDAGERIDAQARRVEELRGAVSTWRAQDRRISGRNAEISLQMINDVRLHLRNDVGPQLQSQHDGMAALRAGLGNTESRISDNVREINDIKAQLSNQHQLITGLRSDLDNSLQAIRNSIRELDGGIAGLRGRATKAEQAIARIDGAIRASEAMLRDVRSLSERRLATAMKDASRLGQLLHEARLNVRRLLEAGIATAASDGQNVFPGLVRADRPAAADVLPMLYEEVCNTLGVPVIFRELAGSSFTRFYLRWLSPDHDSPEKYFGDLLLACRDGDRPTSPGLDAFQGLLRAVDRSGGAVIQIGPLIVSGGQRDLAGGILATADILALGIHDAHVAQPALAARMRQLAGDRIVELMPQGAR